LNPAYTSGPKIAAPAKAALENTVSTFLGGKMLSGSKRVGIALALGTAVALAACKKSDEYAATDTGAKDTGTAMAADTGAPPPAALSDPNIVFILDNANMLDSAAGAVAATKGTSADVRGFGKRMMRDHHSLRQQGQDLAKKLNVTPEAPPNDNSKAQFDNTMKTLNGAAKGKDFDKAYIDNEVVYHQAVLQTATSAMNAAQNAELKNLIQKAAPLIQAHLDMAQGIQKKMQ
jgi:putative membrane protein